MMMNRKFALLTAALGIGLTFAAAPAFAQETATAKAPEGRSEHGGHGGPGRFFQDADANKDGSLTKEEMRAAQEKKLDQMFEHLDADKDGKLSKEELENGRKEMHKRFKKMRSDRSHGEPKAAE